jgi:hypothetical protein
MMKSARYRLAREMSKSKKEEEFEEAKQAIFQKEGELDDLRNQLESYKESHLEGLENKEKLSKLFESGIIDRNGEPIQH